MKRVKHVLLSKSVITKLIVQHPFAYNSLVYNTSLIHIILKKWNLLNIQESLLKKYSTKCFESFHPEQKKIQDKKMEKIFRNFDCLNLQTSIASSDDRLKKIMREYNILHSTKYFKIWMLNYGILQLFKS